MTDSYLYMFTKAILMLGIVIVVMLLLLWVLKKYMNRGGAVSGAYSSPVKVLSTSFLGPKKSLSIVEVAGEVLVLGITAENINCLARLDRADVIDELKRHEADRPKTVFRFFR